LEGLEVSEVMLSDVLTDNENKRIDSEYFKKYFLNFFNNVPNLRPLSYFVKDGYRVVYESTQIVELDEGKMNNYPYFLQATDLETPFIKTDDLFYVHEADWERYPKGRIKHGEILVEVKGNIEKVSIVPDGFPEKTLVSGSLFKLTINNNISKHVLLCYLISKYGVAFKNRYKTNLLISYISKPDLYRIPVPEFSSSFQIKIDDKFNFIFKYRKQSQVLYRQAECLLLETIGLSNFKPSEKATNIRSFKESFGATGRLDAEYYHPKYEEIEGTIRKYKKGFTPISNQFKQNKTAFDISEKQYNYIEIGDVNVGSGSYAFNMIDVAELPANAKIKAKYGNVLISKVRPNRGAVTIINESIHNLIVSGAFTVLEEKGSYKKEVLFILLRTPYYKEWLLKYNVGTSYPVIKDEDVLSLPIPLIDDGIQQQIAQLVNESFALRQESERLLAEAKELVEREIEK
jgi:restriction endonuclease S subunit